MQYPLHLVLVVILILSKILALAQLRSILHTWLNEKSSSELYQNISVMYQLPNETPQELLVRALSCREKLFCAVKKINQV